MPREQAWLAHLRHELRTPLNHVIGYSEMLLEDLQPQPLASALQRIRSNAKVMLTRVASLLATPEDAATLVAGLAPPLDAIVCELQTLRSLQPLAAPPTLRQDLDHIDSAAAQLQRLLDGGMVPPVRDDGAPAPTPAAGTADHPPHAAGCILVVDDDEGNREILGRWLARDGHCTLFAARGDEALALLRTPGAQPLPDLVLLDIMMPGTSGIAVLAQLKADAALKALPVLMISAYDEAPSVVRCLEGGAEDFLPKPFDPVVLRARVSTALERKRLRDREAQHLRTLAEWNQALEARVAEQVALLDRLGRLKRFFSPPLAEAIVQGGADDPLKSHRREVTVCFLDLRGFTAFAEVAEPEDVMGVLREYHAEMGALVMAHEGTLERFTGDGMMVFFNDPVPVANPVERALRMAQAMRERVAPLVHRWRQHGHELDLGLGIAQGYATIGAIGFEGRWDYGAIGSVTNLAARLCGEARAGQVLLSRRVATQAAAFAKVAPVGEMALKGFARPAAVYELLALKGD
jgi:adenylate cyclase